MNLSDQVRELENELATERKRRRKADELIDDVRDVLVGFSESESKPWGRTLQKLGRIVGVEVKT